MTEAEFAQLADLLPDALLLVDGHGVLRAANPAAAALLERPAPALPGQRLAELVHDGEERIAALLQLGARSRARVPGALCLRAATGHCRCEVALVSPRAAGREPLVLLRLVPKPAADRQFHELNARIGALSREVMRRRAAEAQLQAYGERLRVTLTSIGDGMIATDAQGRVTMMNGVAQALTGWDEAQALGRPVAEVFVIVHQHTREPVPSPVERVLRDGRVAGLANHTVLVARDGSERPIDDSGAPIRDAGGALIGAILVFRDISERYAMERALRLQTERLIEADRRKDEFLSMLAHELRNPLAPLHNGVHLLLSGRQGPEGQHRIVQMLQRQLGHITRLVDDLLDVARLTQGRIELRREPVALAPLLHQALEASRPLLQARGHAVQEPQGVSDLVVDADPARLVQVFTNLLVNAAKFTPPGGRIELDCRREAEAVCVAVRDNGVGIEPALLPRVFELFMQADRSLDRSQGGLGIGLTVVRGLVEMHGGSVEARSAGPGRGSEFLVRLPLRQPGAAGSSPENGSAPPAPAAARGRRVLVVDDNHDAGDTLRCVLEHWGHEARLADSARAALQAWAELPPQVVLLDIGLPDIDGYELARRLRRQPGGDTVLLVAVTGYGRAPDRQASRDAGIDEHLTKPVDLERLRRVVEG